MQTLERLEDLEPGSRICLFGAGTFGGIIARALQMDFPEVKLVGFLDNFAEGPILGLPVWNPSQLHIVSEHFDQVLITTSSQNEVQDQLAREGYQHAFTVNHGILNAYCLIHPIYQEKIVQTRELFTKSEDKILYDWIIQARQGDIKALKAHVQKLGLTPEDQYLDFIHFDRIKTIVEGGVFDGFSSREFLKRTSQGTKLYGFEPFIEKYECSPIKLELDQKSVEVFPFALWNQNTTLDFETDSENPEESGGASKIARYHFEHATRQVKAVRIDDWMESNQIKEMDFFKLDIEGAEPEAMEGAKKSLQKFRPQLAICIYHHPSHLFQIPLTLAAWLPNYTFRVQHYSQEIWETVFYGIPNEIADE